MATPLSPLTALEAYNAGREDFKFAVAAAHMVENEQPRIAGMADRVFLSMLAELWQARIRRGQLPDPLEGLKEAN